MLIFIPNIKALDINSVECNKDGSLKFTIAGTDEDESYTKDMSVEINDKSVIGTWDRESLKDSYSVNQRYAAFSLPENSLNENKQYSITLDYIEDGQSKTKNFHADCPGLVFSCTLLGINIDKCYTENGRFTAEITAKGLKQSVLPYGFNVNPDNALDFTINTKEPYKAKTSIISKIGPLPEEFKITQTDADKYSLTFDLEPDNYVEGITVSMTEERSYPFYMLDMCRTEKYSAVKLQDHESCTVNYLSKPIIVTKEQDNKDSISENQKTNEQENTGNLITGQVLKDQKNSSNYLYTAVIIALVLIIIGLYYQNRKKRW